MPRTTVARSRHLPRSPTFSTTDGQRCNQDCLIEFVPVLRREKSMMGTSVVLQGLHVMNQSTTGGSVRMERAFFQIWNWASSKKSTLHTARSRHLLTILWHFFPLAMFANFPGGPKMNLSAVCFTPFALFPLYLPHHSLQEQFFGYCSRLTPVCLSARGPVYIHPICLIPTFAPNRYYPPRHCNFNWNQSPSSPHWFPTTVNFDQSAPSQIPLPIPFA